MLITITEPAVTHTGSAGIGRAESASERGARRDQGTPPATHSIDTVRDDRQIHGYSECDRHSCSAHLSAHLDGCHRIEREAVIRLQEVKR